MSDELKGSGSVVIVAKGDGSKAAGDENMLWALTEENDRLRAALLRIAAMRDGVVVRGWFDEPGSASIAREALAADWIGPCTHGRDPWDRCDECAGRGRVEAWGWAQLFPFKREDRE